LRIEERFYALISKLFMKTSKYLHFLVCHVLSDTGGQSNQQHHEIDHTTPAAVAEWRHTDTLLVTRRDDWLLGSEWLAVDRRRLHSTQQMSCVVIRIMAYEEVDCFLNGLTVEGPARFMTHRHKVCWVMRQNISPVSLIRCHDKHVEHNGSTERRVNGRCHTPLYMTAGT